MKLSISNIAWEEKEDLTVYRYMKSFGFTGIEIAPTRWVKEKPYDYVEVAKKIAENIEKMYGYTVASMQSIWFGKQEKVFAKEEERKELIRYTKKAIDYASNIGCRNLVFGCPRNRNIEEEWSLSKEQVERIAIAFFKELGDYAYEKGTVIGMEANPRIYHTNFVNTTEEAIELIRKVNSKGFKLNLDVGTMIHNEENVEILIGKVPIINHVHISEPELKLVEKRELHKKLAQILRNENYSGFVSIEMGKHENMMRLEEIMQYVAEVFHD